MLSTLRNSLVIVPLAACLFWAYLATPCGQVEDAVQVQPQGIDLEGMAAERMRRRLWRRQAQQRRRSAAALARAAS